MSHAINRYKSDLRELRFLLFEQFHLEDLLGKAPYADWGKEEVEAVLGEVYAWVCKELGPLNGPGDEVGCVLEGGVVRAPDGFKAAWQALNAAGWRGLAVEPRFGGQAGPFTLHALAEEMMSGANHSFNMYAGLTQGAASLIGEFGTAAQIESFAMPLYSGEWAGTMCLTEPHAGSDVGSVTTKAVRRSDGSYDLRGTKIFISGGDHDLTANIVHLVLARVEGAPAGTKGLSLFIVPKLRKDGAPNDVVCAALEHKMGIRASSTAQLNFGENGGCVGELLGTEEQHGIAQMFQLMNSARIAVGIQGLALASAAYLNAHDYAKERRQGSSIKQWKDATAPRVPIIEHADVRRMLLDMKARVEGIRALAMKLTMHVDREQAAGADREALEYHRGQIDLMVPLLKAYASDQAFEISATAIQVFGGAGYLKDHPIEQYCRDAKILSIYEGTNHIQALDLVGRKLGARGGANFQQFAKEVGDFVKANREHPALGAGVATLGAAMDSLAGAAMRFLGWFTGGKMEMVPLAANRFLDMMSETTVGWLLLEGAVIADKAAQALPEGHADRAFYAGKKYAAQYYAGNVLPGVVHKATLVGKEDRTAIEIPEAAFATV